MTRTEAIIAEAAKLLGASGLVPPGVLILAMVALAVLLVLAPPIGEALWNAIKNIKLGPPPTPPSDGEQPGDHDPGAVEGGGPPGGGETGGMG